ncbi:MAG: transposase [Candidatus Nealsonbacteria bacterium]|nr:transposase [Candidatus Nealsonbacteria bacterium]
MKRVIFAKDQIYHVYNRGVEKRNIFLDDKDYFRFIHNLFEFNDEKPAENIYYKQPMLQSQKIQSYEASPRKINMPRKLLVEIMAFCLMPNHYHLLLRQKQDRGITRFMQKLGTGYSMYFNQKHERTGILFQGPFKAILVDRETYFYYLPYYIHFNPLDLIEPEWRNGKINNYKEALNFLENYRWSSHLDYIGKKNFPSVTQREFLLEYHQNGNRYKQSIENWLKEIQLEKIKDIMLE